ncbi:dihydrolipoamide acetyltransferase family protein [Nocardia africana]|uniref:Dihydrolipoamide acetyltransferase component of pyruvate dehydrogenase complex n=1 Tax=Nocardia africana TaxID=134964 RepID=A0ABW6NED9_9NOCA
MSDQVFLLPDLGEGLTEAEILEWKVKVGDTVTIDQPVVEVETAKAAVEVPIPFEGVVVTLHGEEGTTLEVGRPLITVRGTATATPSLEAPNPSHDQYREEERAGSGNVLIGYGTSAEPDKRRRRVRPAHANQESTVEPRLPAQTAGSRDARSDENGQLRSGSARVISPIVRDLASKNAVDLTAVQATGAGGVIVRADVERALSAGAGPDRDPRPATGDQRVPLKGLRKAVAEKLSTSRREIPDATTWVDVDVTELLAARQEMNHVRSADDRISLLALVARLTIAALREFPELNSSVDTTREEIVQYQHINLGIAAQTPRGLVVPVIERAEELGTTELSRQLAETTALARAGKLPPNRLTGGTFTLNNYGVFGVDGSTPIINYPEAAILGVGRIMAKPWVIHDQVCVRQISQISLSFDHRVCDGGTAGGFLRLLGDYLEHPILALGRL